ncbi:exonuclease subunit SbcD [Fluviispira multicolorata]|uniref:Nuclease SbcCD subunit D n=1 Tax=Fluviispira multicolorata TaxID=2654512 RepID=A0A833N5T6_9BACT|nr:exonuclease subunit SbcD [Fluviispira multicolorata]KAB8028535.1 exonuclease subunit SbcD [Fluviispira multicolorata]
MKILHTSDWHLGATYEGVSREEDHQYFLKWLIETLITIEIDILLIAGDIFDQTQPSSEAHKCYYQFLFQVSQKTKVKKVIILGGNHDSPSRLDAPAELLKLLDVFVVGGFSGDSQNLERYLCPIYSKNNEIELIIAAVPYIHEFRLGVRTAFLSEKEIQTDFKNKFTELYKKLADKAEEINKNVPLIATGHMACTGSERDDSPLEVHMIGTLGNLPKEIFDSRFCYIALGHVHRSYKIENSNAYYSGSPISLSIKESKTDRSVFIINIDKANNVPQVEKLKVPILRNIVELKGEIDEIYAKIKNLKWETPLPPFLSLQISVESYTIGIDYQIRKQIESYFSLQTNNNENQSHFIESQFSKLIPIISQIKQTPIHKKQNKNLFSQEKSLKQLTVEEVFVKICELKNQAVDENLLSAFRSLLSNENL